MKKSKIFSLILVVAMMLTLVALTTVPAFAEEAAPVAAEAAQEAIAESNVTSAKALASAIAIALVGAAGAIGMAWAIAKSAESIARQPEAAGKINSVMMLGLVFIETAIIYALIIAILVIFVL